MNATGRPCRRCLRFKKTLSVAAREKLEELREVLLEGAFVFSVECGDAVEGTAMAG